MNLPKIFRGFLVFEYALERKPKNPETQEIDRQFCKPENTHR